MKKILPALLCLCLGGALIFVLLKKGSKKPPVSLTQEESSCPPDRLTELPSGRYALSITVPGFAAGFSGKLLPGDLVSVFAPDAESGKIAQPLLLRYVEVITTTTSGGLDRENVTEKDDGTIPLPASVTLLVNEDQARLLIELEAAGKLHLAFVCRREDPRRASFLTQQEEWLLYGEPLPLWSDEEESETEESDLLLYGTDFLRWERSV